MSSPWQLVTPASRGIGHALSRQLLLKTRAPLVSTARRDLDGVRSSVLENLQKDGAGQDALKDAEKRFHVLELDCTDEGSISECASKCKELFPSDSHHLHLAYMLPGILHPEKAPQQIDAEKALDTFKINTLGPMLLAKHFTGFLPKKATSLPETRDAEGLPATPTIAMMAARVGSITDNRAGGWYSYRSSKAAVTQLVKSFDIYVRNTSGEKGMFLGLHPGTVKTNLSKEFWESVGEKGLLSPEQSAEHLYNVVVEQSQGQQGRGRCWDWKGEEVPP